METLVKRRANKRDGFEVLPMLEALPRSGFNFQHTSLAAQTEGLTAIAA